MSNTSWFIARTAFSEALSRVRQELHDVNLWRNGLPMVKVRQVPLGIAYGWQHYQGSGDIVIPNISLVRIVDKMMGVTVPLLDTLRHEYAHAFAQIQVGFLGCSKFVSAFGGSHDSPNGGTYSDNVYVSKYASDNPGEDFAETFMCYLRHQGKLPDKFDTPFIKKKWKFVSELEKNYE